MGPTVPATLRIEVADSRGERPPAQATAFPAPTAEAGRGLLLVDALAAHWGTEPVWAELCLA